MAAILITGASTGIGEACALRLDHEGHRVLAGVRSDDDANRLRTALSDRSEPVILDVTNPDQIAKVAARIDESMGGEGLVGLVNNAGVARGGPIEYLSLDEWRDQFEINFFGQIAVTQAMLPAIRRGNGRIAFVGSIGGRASNPMIAPYSASKHAIEALAESLRDELLPWGIEVSVIEPGAVNTPIWDKGRASTDRIERELPEEARERYAGAIADVRENLARSEGTGVDPDKVAKAIEHALLSSRPRHRYLVGQDAHLAGFMKRVLPDKAFAEVRRRFG